MKKLDEPLEMPRQELEIYSASQAGEAIEEIARSQGISLDRAKHALSMANARIDAMVERKLLMYKFKREEAVEKMRLRILRDMRKQVSEALSFLLSGEKEVIVKNPEGGNSTVTVRDPKAVSDGLEHFSRLTGGDHGGSGNSTILNFQANLKTEVNNPAPSKSSAMSFEERLAMIKQRQADRLSGRAAPTIVDVQPEESKESWDF